MTALEEEYINLQNQNPHPNLNFYPPNSILSIVDAAGGFDTTSNSEFDPLPGFKIPQYRRNPGRTESHTNLISDLIRVIVPSARLYEQKGERNPYSLGYLSLIDVIRSFQVVVPFT